MINTLLNKTLELITTYLFPRACIACNTLVLWDGLCNLCFQELEFITKPFCKKCGKMFHISLNTNEQEELMCANCLRWPNTYDIARSLLKFNQASQKLIHNLKYYDKTSIVKTIARLLYEKYFQEINDYDLIIPVPMHKIKRLWRLYNQAQILGYALAKEAKIDLYNNILLKSKLNSSQTRLTFKERVKNIMPESFTISQKYLIEEKNIILVDDVITTGTTAEVCSQLLKKAGAAKVLVLTIASTGHFN